MTDGIGRGIDNTKKIENYEYKENAVRERMRNPIFDSRMLRLPKLLRV